jgi:hypothetical protein
LLVTELQNQDPTADTDPNEYVDQLVQVNSLQQLIQMNQTLDGGPTLTGASNGVLQERTRSHPGRTMQSATGRHWPSNNSLLASKRTCRKSRTNSVKLTRLNAVIKERKVCLRFRYR